MISLLYCGLFLFIFVIYPLFRGTSNGFLDASKSGPWYTRLSLEVGGEPVPLNGAGFTHHIGTPPSGPWASYARTIDITSISCVRPTTGRARSSSRCSAWPTCSSWIWESQSATLTW